FKTLKTATTTACQGETRLLMKAPPTLWSRILKTRSLYDDSCGRSGWRAAALQVGSPAHPRNSPEQISGDPEAQRNARARCSGPPCTTPLDYAACTGPDPPRRGAR